MRAMDRVMVTAIAGALLLAGCSGTPASPEQSPSTARALADGCGSAPAHIEIQQDDDHAIRYGHVIWTPIHLLRRTPAELARNLRALHLPPSLAGLEAQGIEDAPDLGRHGSASGVYAPHDRTGQLMPEVIAGGGVAVSVRDAGAWSKDLLSRSDPTIVRLAVGRSRGELSAADTATTDIQGYDLV